MDSAKVETWERFFDEVVVGGAEWPRALWLAAVDDALARALGPESPLVVRFRADLAELTRLERAARGSYEDEKRAASLEAGIRETIETADRLIRESAPPSEPSSVLPDPGAPSPTWGRAFGLAAFALFVLGAGLLAAVHLYDARLATQVGREVGGYVERLQTEVGRVEDHLAARVDAVDERIERLAAMRGEVARDLATLDDKVASSLEAMTALREGAVADLERRLDDTSSSVAGMLEQVKARGEAVDQDLDEVATGLARAERRLPTLSRDLTRLDDQVEAGEAAVTETMEELAALQAAAPAIIARVREERQKLEQKLEAETAAVAKIEAAIDRLDTRVGAVAARLDRFGGAIEDGLAQAREDGELLKQAVADMRATGAVVAELAATADAELGRIRSRAETRIDAMLSDLAEKADLATMRGQDVLERAEDEAVRRIEQAGEDAVVAVAELREQGLGDLGEEIAATRAELKRTHAGLMTSWERMDRRVAERQEELLAGLDGYARTVEARVRQLIEALDVAPAATLPVSASPAEVATTEP